MSEHGLTPEDLKQQHSIKIAKSSTFKTRGVSPQAAIDYLRTPEGKVFWHKLADADPSVDTDEIAKRAIGQIRSGRDLPRMEVIDEPLVKIVPAGVQDKSLAYSPYFAKLSEYEDAVAKGHNLNDRFGLPVKSEAPVYDVYRIDPKAPTEVFVSTVAPTSELDGQVTRAGGATQYLVPNRTLFTEAVRATSIGNDLALHHDLVGKGLGAPIAAAEAATRSLRPGMGAAVKGLGALGVLATTYDAVSTGERIETLLAQDNLLGAKHEARDFAVNNANAWAAAYAVGTLGAELGGRRGVQGAIAGGIAGGIVGYVLSDKAMAGLDAREIVNQTDAQGRPWTFNGRQWVKPMQADLHDDGVDRTHAQAFSANFDTRRALDYKAAHTVVTIALRRPPPRNPYRRIGLTPDAALTAMEICP